MTKFVQAVLQNFSGIQVNLFFFLRCRFKNFGVDANSVDHERVFGMNFDVVNECVYGESELISIFDDFGDFEVNVDVTAIGDSLSAFFDKF